MKIERLFIYKRNLIWMYVNLVMYIIKVFTENKSFMFFEFELLNAFSLTC